MPCDGCDIEFRVKQLEDDIKRNSESREKIYIRINKLEQEGKLIAYQYTHIINSLTELRTDVTELKNKPNRRMDTVITAIITSGIGALIMYFITFVNWVM